MIFSIPVAVLHEIIYIIDFILLYYFMVQTFLFLFVFCCVGVYANEGHHNV